MCAALEEVTTPWIFALATDMPFVEPALIELLAQRRAGFDAVVPVADGHPQPLCGLLGVAPVLAPQPSTACASRPTSSGMRVSSAMP